jgi:uroporphyrinogen-III synthase
MRRVLVLRPEPGASATVTRARERGLDAIASPLFELEPIAWRAPDASGFDGLLLTSASAVRHGGAQLAKLRSLPVYAVGEATAAAAREAGFTIAAAGDGGIDRLLGFIPLELGLLHLCGEDRREPSDSRAKISAIAVYGARIAEHPNLELANGAVALVHSPRAGRRLAELVTNRETITIAAISPEAAKAAGTGWEAVEAADVPSDEALLALAARLCNKPLPK